MGLFSEKELFPEPNCAACRLFEQVRSPKMGVTGKGRLGILAFAEAPGEQEDIQGKQLVGDAGSYLREELAIHRLHLDRDFWKVNAVNCRPTNDKGSNRAPSDDEIMWCRPLSRNVITQKKPKAIFLFGNKSLQSFFDNKPNKVKFKITSWNGLRIPDYRYNCWVFPMLHPSYIIRSNKSPLIASVFARDLDNALRTFEDPLPEQIDLQKHVRIVTDFSEAKKALQRLINDRPLTTFDYETTGKKPYKEGHTIAVLSYCRVDEDFAVTIPYNWPNLFSEKEKRIIQGLWKKFLKCGAPTVNHNFAFEDMWSRTIVGAPISNMHSCTMTDAHIIDSRVATTGLKFQVFTKWGLTYSDEIDHFIDKSNRYGFNKVFQAPYKKLALYCGADSYLTMKLLMAQEEIFDKNEGLQSMRSLFKGGLQSLSDMTDHGFAADGEYYAGAKETILKKMERIEDSLYSTPEAKLFEKKTGKQIKYTSSKDLKRLLFEFLGEEVVKTTPSGEPSTDEETISNYNYALCKRLTKYRKLQKVENTYLAQFLRESTEGVIHPMFNLHTVETGRSSSNAPNFQNIPKRDKESKKICRAGILPSKGRQLFEIDYSSLEVRINSIYSKDPNLLKYVNDPTTDMHRDQAMEIFLLPAELVTKEIRFFAKNGYVFPVFYGSYFEKTAPDLWLKVVQAGLRTQEGELVKDYLARQGIIRYPQFLEHMKQVEDNFWVKFKATKEWREDVVKFYTEHGYVENKFGWRRLGPMIRNEIINTPIQGTAFQCLLWAIVETDKVKKEEKWDSHFVGQIHDAAVIDMVPEEASYVVGVFEHIACKKIREVFPWIIAPLDVEVEATKIDSPWSTIGEIDHVKLVETGELKWKK